MTLVEVMIASALAAMVMAAVLSSQLFIARTTYAMANYQTMDQESRKVLDRFARDVRMASAIETGQSHVTLTNGSSLYAGFGGQVTYAYDASTSGPTAKALYLMPGSSSANNARQILARNVNSFTVTRIAADDSVAGSDALTKKIRVTLSLSRAVAGGATATDSTSSALLVLRNK